MRRLILGEFETPAKEGHVYDVKPSPIFRTRFLQSNSEETLNSVRRKNIYLNLYFVIFSNLLH